MCEFCKDNKDNKPIISSIKQFSDRIETVVAEIKNGKLTVSTMVQMAELITPLAIAESEIKFCPMCENKLN